MGNKSNIQWLTAQMSNLIEEYRVGKKIKGQIMCCFMQPPMEQYSGKVVNKMHNSSTIKDGWLYSLLPLLLDSFAFSEQFSIFNTKFIYRNTN